MINKRIIGENVEIVKNNLLCMLYSTTLNFMDQQSDKYLYSTKSFEELCELIKEDGKGNFFVDVEFLVKYKFNLGRVR